MKARETNLLKGYDVESQLNDFLNKVDLSFSTRKKQVPILEWVTSIQLGARPFKFEHHEYQRDILTCNARKMALLKGAQVGISETQILKTLHGLIFGRYPAGALYLFPSSLDSSDFSKARFGPLIDDNAAEIGKYITATDATSVKRIGKATLYVRGSRATGKISGVKKDSSQLRSIAVDRCVKDECDSMEPSMISLANERLSHSEIAEDISLGTPSLPDYGISKSYDESDQRVWEIKCSHCNTGTVLELEFPNSLLELSDGRVIRACKKCKEEIFSKDGRWIIRFPERSKDMAGFWISQLNSHFVSPATILHDFQDPPNGNLAEVYNSKLAQPWVSAENRLSLSDIYQCCGQDMMATKATGPCCMGVDVGKLLHVLVGIKTRESLLELIYFARVSSFNDVHDIAKRFNVACCCIDAEPETRKAREFQESETFETFLCDYSDRTIGTVWDEEKGMVRVNRTEICDTTHELFTKPGVLILPRRCDEVDRFAQQVRNIAKVLQEDPETGSREYRYRKLGEDHFRHALNYCYLASTKIGVAESFYSKHQKERKAELNFDVFKYDDQGKRDDYPF